jgi:hypothetical protein
VVELLLFAALVAVVAVVGIRVGILVAPRLGRLADAADAPDAADEETRDDDG